MRLLCSTNSESELFAILQIFSYALNPLSACCMFGENVMLLLIVGEMNMLRYICLLFTVLTWLCLLLTVLCQEVWPSFGWNLKLVVCTMPFLELRSFVTSVAPWEHSTAPTWHWPQGTTLAEMLWGSKEDVVHSTSFASTIKLDARGQSWNTEEVACVVQLPPNFWCSKYCYRHSLFNCVGSHHWKTV